MDEMEGRPCWACRKRRLICDYGRPSCNKCAARGVECPGYEHKPLRWVEPGQTLSKRRRNRAAVPPSVEIFGHDVVALVQAVEYFNHNVCPDMVADGSTGPANPFYLPLDALDSVAPATADILISSTMGHRILRAVDRPHSEKAALASRLQFHRGRAIRSLAENVAETSSTQTLACVLAFLLSEIQQSISVNWRQHLDAAWTLVDGLGGLSEIMDRLDVDHAMLRYLFIVDILGATTSPSEEREHDAELKSLVHSVESIQTCSPCPEELLAYVMSVTSLRGSGDGVHVLREIRLFSVQAWVDGMKGTHSWLSLALALQAAVVLYCAMSLFEPDRAIDGETALDAVRRNKQAVLRNLQNVKGQLRKFTIWPLTMLGISLEANDAEGKSFVAAELKWTSASCGTAAPLVAVAFLERLWAEKYWYLSGRTWDSLFDRPYVFVL